MNKNNIKLGEVRKTSKSLKMKFTLDNNRSTTLSLANPKDNLTLAEVMDVGETMVAKEAIIVGGSPIASLSDVYTETVTITELS